MPKAIPRGASKERNEKLGRFGPDRGIINASAEEKIVDDSKA